MNCPECKAALVATKKIDRITQIFSCPTHGEMFKKTFKKSWVPMKTLAPPNGKVIHFLKKWVEVAYQKMGYFPYNIDTALHDMDNTWLEMDYALRHGGIHNIAHDPMHTHMCSKCMAHHLFKATEAEVAWGSMISDYRCLTSVEKIEMIKLCRDVLNKNIASGVIVIERR